MSTAGSVPRPVAPLPKLPDGVILHRLETHVDDRGVLFEAYRAEWYERDPTPQWNIVRSIAGVLRGVHVHRVHYDYLTLLTGRVLVGLRDMRPESATSGLAALVTLHSDSPAALVIPPGVGHGFYFPVASMYAYAMSPYWDPSDDLGCRWDDPGLGIPWPFAAAQLSERDQTAPSFESLLATFADPALAAPVG